VKGANERFSTVAFKVGCPRERAEYVATGGSLSVVSNDPHANTHGENKLDPGNPRFQRMCDDNDQTKPRPKEFDFSAFPPNTVFHERRTGRERREDGSADKKPEAVAPRAVANDQRTKKERRRRIDPTTFEKQYSVEEMEFMNAMQRFKESTGKSFPTYGEVLKVAAAIGYRRVVIDEEPSWDHVMDDEPCLAESSSIDLLA